MCKQLKFTIRLDFYFRAQTVYTNEHLCADVDSLPTSTGIHIKPGATQARFRKPLSSTRSFVQFIRPLPSSRLSQSHYAASPQYSAPMAPRRSGTTGPLSFTSEPGTPNEPSTLRTCLRPRVNTLPFIKTSTFDPMYPCICTTS